MSNFTFQTDEQAQQQWSRYFKADMETVWSAICPKIEGEETNIAIYSHPRNWGMANMFAVQWGIRPNQHTLLTRVTIDGPDPDCYPPCSVGNFFFEGFFSEDESGEKVLSVTFLMLHHRHWKTGVNREVMSNLVSTSREAGLDRIAVNAVSAWAPHHVRGAYVWPRYGFVPEEYYWENALKPRIEAMLKPVQGQIQPGEKEILETSLESEDPRGLRSIAALKSPIAHKGKELALGFYLLGDETNKWLEARVNLDLHSEQDVDYLMQYALSDKQALKV